MQIAEVRADAVTFVVLGRWPSSEHALNVERNLLAPSGQGGLVTGKASVRYAFSKGMQGFPKAAGQAEIAGARSVVRGLQPSVHGLRQIHGFNRAITCLATRAEALDAP